MKQILQSIVNQSGAYLKEKRLIILITFSLIALLATAFIIFLFVSNKPKCIEGNCKNGFGKLRFSDGATYTGNFEQFQFHGFGIFHHPKGDFYQGGWLFGKKNGKGVYEYADKSKYEGEFLENKKQGVGVFTWPGGETSLKANFFQGEPEGPGELTVAGGIKLFGVYRKGVIFDGKGIYIYKDGTKYIGEWKSGKRSGFGTYLDADGNILKIGTWKEDEFLESTR
ncbi:MORN repeat-containing protein [Leptospira kmetyi]|uniref:MORN repeat-containing protein n=1 Tax=Leptospira kmetyi TaxID=408139 RepID=UPI0010827473|nr:membrane-binding protein [Leptospira kmetyi]TGK18869.1 membrane-binding protein [Leptospira kmetyi]TGK26951.1 membrane-binding protein [Leptospira kmetyi]